MKFFIADNFKILAIAELLLHHVDHILLIIGARSGHGVDVPEVANGHFCLRKYLIPEILSLNHTKFTRRPVSSRNRQRILCLYACVNAEDNMFILAHAQP